MHLVYIDDSKDGKMACFSALSIPEDQWNAALDHLVNMRRHMRDSDGVFVRKEIHATEFVSGRGRLAPNFVPKAARARLFDYMLSSISMMPGAQLFNAAARSTHEERLFEYLLNRINVNMSKSGSRALIISDEGKNYDAMLRRIRRHNPIPSMYGQWGDGRRTKSIKADLILEDIVYRDSAKSLFVQMADCCAYALLRRENPIASKTKYGLDKSFYNLEPIMVKAANGKDPYGVIR